VGKTADGTPTYSIQGLTSYGETDDGYAKKYAAKYS
jgi:hypothetical protein